MDEFKAYTQKEIDDAIRHYSNNLDLSEAFAAVRNYQGPDEDFPIDEVLCNKWIFSPIRDSVSGGINLSSFSTKNPSVGQAIIIHELGHVVSIALAAMPEENVKFKKIRLCLSKNYSLSKLTQSYSHSQEYDKFWTEEDWADSFSAFALRKVSEKNFNCGFVKFSNLKDRAYLRSEKDPHSPDLYRLLNTEAHLGRQLTDSCKLAVDKLYPNEAIEDCISKNL